jgi:hypothetical protein
MTVEEIRWTTPAGAYRDKCFQSWTARTITKYYSYSSTMRAQTNHVRKFGFFSLSARPILSRLMFLMISVLLAKTSDEVPLGSGQRSASPINSSRSGQSNTSKKLPAWFY